MCIGTRENQMGETSGSFALSNLLCHETDSCLKEEEEEEADDDEKVRVRSECDPRFLVSGEDEEEYVRELVRRETRWLGSEPNASSSCVDCTVAGGIWLRSARVDAVDWILNTREIFGFQYHTAYLSISYFDWFFSKRSIDEGKSWAVRLLSVSCLSLAAKMEECRVPPLSEFVLEDYVFEAKVVRRMELLVLSTLDWKMGLITPFTYLHYFIGKFIGGESSIAKGLVSRAVEFLLAVAKEISLMDYMPSVIAAAAVLAASDSKLTRKDLELKIGEISSLVSQENECVFSCYNLIQKIEMRKYRTPDSVISRDLSSAHSTSNDAVENSSFASGGGTKRRLSFDSSDQNCSVKKMHQP